MRHTRKVAAVNTRAPRSLGDGADDLGVEDALVGELDADLVGTIDHMDCLSGCCRKVSVSTPEAEAGLARTRAAAAEAHRRRRNRSSSGTRSA